ncbi:unnamed protein product [Cylindrotheca closterium]|uniref:Uncharacterized protein n=1 Tax=Cylindrotheca closterium TaxID=2856 RepID=A0AAD2FIR4_9STRA|nr:unnamed protein product [Cylindrotheca closterium]
MHVQHHNTRQSKKDQRQTVARQSKFHFPGFTSSSEDDEPPAAVVTAKKRKRRVSSSASNNKKRKKIGTISKRSTVSKKGNSRNHLEKVQKKLSCIPKPSNASPAASVLTKKQKHDAKLEKVVDNSVELIEDPPTIRRTTSPEVNAKLFDRDPPATTLTPNELFLEEEEEELTSSFLLDDDHDNGDDNIDDLPLSPKWAKVRPISNTKYTSFSFILLLAFAVPYFHHMGGRDDSWSSGSQQHVVRKLQGVKNQDWKKLANPEHNVFSEQTNASSKDQQHCFSTDSLLSSYFSFY